MLKTSKKCYQKRINTLVGITLRTLTNTLSDFMRVVDDRLVFRKG